MKRILITLLFLFIGCDLTSNKKCFLASNIASQYHERDKSKTPLDKNEEYIYNRNIILKKRNKISKKKSDLSLCIECKSEKVIFEVYIGQYALEDLRKTYKYNNEYTGFDITVKWDLYDNNGNYIDDYSVSVNYEDMNFGNSYSLKEIESIDDYNDQIYNLFSVKLLSQKTTSTMNWWK